MSTLLETTRITNERTHGRRVVVVSPVRNEEDLLPGAIASMASQTLQPALWVIVDDGSSDRTAEIAERAAATYDWIRVIRRSDRGARKLGGGVIDAFYAGLETVDIEFDFIGKMDADLTFSSDYLRRIVERFAIDPALGAASGKVFRPEKDHEVEEFMIDEMVAGQWKLYRRECFEAIGGLVREVMWDGIDFHRARQVGYVTRSFAEPTLRIRHHRLMGSSDRGILRGRRRWGKGQWFMGTHPLYMIASAALRATEKPYVVGGFMMLVGYFGAMLRGDRRYGDQSFRRELRAWQMRRLRRLVLKGEVR